jgi:hypothetical protein
MELFHQATCRMKVFNLFLNEALEAIIEWVDVGPVEPACQTIK